MSAWLVQTYGSVQRDLIEFFRYRIAVISSLLTALVMVLAYGLSSGGSDYVVAGVPYLHYVVPGLLAVGTMYSCMYSAGYAIVLDRQRRLIDDIVLSPTAYSSFVVGRVLGNVVKSSIQLVLALAIAMAFFGLPPPDALVLGVAFVLTVVLFAAIGMALASYTDVLSFGGFANLVTLPCMFFSGVFFPITYYNPSLAAVLQFVPLTPAVELFRYAFTKETVIGSFFTNLALLSVGAGLTVFVGVAAFRSAVTRG